MNPYLTNINVRRGLLSVALLVVLAWPALFNGQPIFHTDTSAYIRGADAGIQFAFHRRSPWSLSGENAIVNDPQAQAPDPAAAASDRGTESVSSIKNQAVLAGRSPYYGALLYVGEITHGFWLTVALQSLLLLCSLLLLLRAALLPTWRLLPGIGAILAVGTSAPFFVSFLMPDFFAAIAIIGCAVMLGAGERLRPIDYASWLLLLSAAALFHDSHTLIIGTLLLLCAAARLARRKWTLWRGPAVLVLVLLVAELGQVLFGAIVEHVVHAPPVRPPFVMARMIGDGVGVRYLRATCPANGFTVCEFLHRMPISDAQFLWPTEAGPGLFSQAPPATRRALSAEQYRFAIAVLKFDPLSVMSAALRDFGEQLSMLRLDEFQYDAYAHGYFPLKIPAEHLTRLKNTPAWREAMPTGLFSSVMVATFVGSMAILIYFARSGRARLRIAPPVGAIALWLIVGVVVNSAICGALSDPHARYSARVEWLVPLAAMLVAAAAISCGRAGRETVKPTA